VTFQESFSEKIRQAFAVEEEQIDSVEEEEANTKLLDEVAVLEEILDRVEELSGEGNTFLQDLLSARDEFGESILFSETILGSADNLFLSLNLADMLSEENWEKEVPGDLFGFVIHELPDFDRVSKLGGDRVRVAAFEPATGRDHFIAFFDFREVSDLRTALRDDGFRELDGGQLSLAAVATLFADAGESLLGKCFCVSASESAEARSTTLKYHLVLSGLVLVEPKPLIVRPDFTSVANTLEVSEHFEQFLEPFEMLGEFNSRTSVLDSFLSAYHALENYMLRARIAEVANTQNNNSIFSIRDFKRLSLASEDSEQKHLQKLFEACWDEVIGGQSLSDFANQCFTNLLAQANFDSSDFDDFLGRLTLRRPGSPAINTANWPEFRGRVPKLIYLLRCSVVHNKETEYHISNREIDNQTRLLVVTDFCIPVMSRLAFGIPALTHNNPVKYNMRAISLY